MTVVHLPTEIVARYRAVDRELIGAPAHVADTPAHLDALTADIGEQGVLVPLDLAFNDQFATLDGNHRIAVAIRLGLEEVPVILRELPLDPRPYWAQTMDPADYKVLVAGLRRPRADYSGMTTNERLNAAGLLHAYDAAISVGDRRSAIAILGQVDLADQAEWIVDTVLADPPKYGYPNSQST